MYHRPAIGDVVRYEDTDEWDTERPIEEREVGIVISINDEDDYMTIQWLNSTTAIHAEVFKVSDLAPHLTILSKG
jgi:hypothetical protein